MTGDSTHWQWLSDRELNSRIEEIQAKIDNSLEITEAQIDRESHELSSEVLEYTSELMAITINIDGGSEPITQDVAFVEDFVGNVIAGIIYAGEVINGLNILDSFANNKTSSSGKSSGKGSMGNNKKQNEEVISLVKKYNLTREQQRILHDYITKQGFTREEIEEIIKTGEYLMK